MFKVIPIQKTLHSFPPIESNTAFIIGINVFARLLSYDKYPIERNKAIINILEFLKEKSNKVRYDDDTIVTIKRDTLVKFFTTKNYKKYLDILKELKIISSVPYLDGTFYKEGKLYTNYRIFNSYLKDDLCLIIIENDKPMKIFTDEKYPDKYVKTIKNIEIDYEVAITEEINYVKDNNRKLLYRINAILSLNASERFIKKGSKVDRIFNSVSNISRISRHHLSCGKEKFHNVDVATCQPTLLAAYLIGLNLQVDEKYIFDCQSSNFYEQFMSDTITRDDAKVLTYKNILFDFKPDSEISSKFKELYPLTYNSLIYLIENNIINDDIKLARKLQNLEASITNKIIPKKSKYYFTLFDAIYFTEISDCVHIIEEFKVAFLQYNLKPQFKIS